MIMQYHLISGKYERVKVPPNVQSDDEWVVKLNRASGKNVQYLIVEKGKKNGKT